MGPGDGERTGECSSRKAVDVAPLDGFMGRGSDEAGCAVIVDVSRREEVAGEVVEVLEGEREDAEAPGMERARKAAKKLAKKGRDGGCVGIVGLNGVEVDVLLRCVCSVECPSNARQSALIYRLAASTWNRRSEDDVGNLKVVYLDRELSRRAAKVGFLSRVPQSGTYMLRGMLVGIWISR